MIDNKYIVCDKRKNKPTLDICICSTNKCGRWHTCKVIQQVWFKKGYTFSRYRKGGGNNGFSEG